MFTEVVVCTKDQLWVSKIGDSVCIAGTAGSYMRLGEDEVLSAVELFEGGL